MPHKFGTTGLDCIASHDQLGKDMKGSGRKLIRDIIPEFSLRNWEKLRK